MEELKALKEKKEYWDMQNHKAYNQGRSDVAQDLLDIFNYDLFLAYSNDDRFISFNNLSLMIRDIAYKLKEQNIK